MCLTTDRALKRHKTSPNRASENLSGMVMFVLSRLFPLTRELNGAAHVFLVSCGEIESPVMFMIIRVIDSLIESMPSKRPNPS